MRTSPARRLVRALALGPLLLLAACTTTTRVTKVDGTANDDGARQGAAEASALSCSEVAACADTCGTDRACTDACVADTTSEAQSILAALEACANENACQDSSCLTDKCSAELEACRSDASGSGGSDGSSASAGGAGSSGGSVPAELVGTWTSSGGGTSIVRTFHADGSYHESSGLTAGGSCPMTTTWDVEGRATFGATTVTFDRLSGTMLSKSCSGEKESPVSPSSESKSWRLEGGVLYTWGPDCSDYKTCGVEFTK